VHATKVRNCSYCECLLQGALHTWA
jgi:hypothetical protein